jgi:uncharacterized protein YerC
MDYIFNVKEEELISLFLAILILSNYLTCYRFLLILFSLMLRSYPSINFDVKNVEDMLSVKISLLDSNHNVS